MKYVRSLAWLLVFAGLLYFSFFNWRSVPITFWPEYDYDVMLPAIVICSFLMGLFPMWLVHRARKWQFKRKINNLEKNAKTQSEAHEAALREAKTAAQSADTGADAARDQNPTQDRTQDPQPGQSKESLLPS